MSIHSRYRPTISLPPTKPFVSGQVCQPDVLNKRTCVRHLYTACRDDLIRQPILPIVVCRIAALTIFRTGDASNPFGTSSSSVFRLRQLHLPPTTGVGDCSVILLAKYPSEYASYTDGTDGEVLLSFRGAGTTGKCYSRQAGFCPHAAKRSHTFPHTLCSLSHALCLAGTLYEPRSGSSIALGWPAGSRWSPQVHIHAGGALGVNARLPVLLKDVSPDRFDGNTLRQSPYQGLISGLESVALAQVERPRYPSKCRNIGSSRESPRAAHALADVAGE